MQSLPNVLEGDPVDYEFPPFSSVCKHFIQSLLTKNYLNRPTSEEIFKHPFITSITQNITEMQLMVPDTLLKCYVCRPHRYNPGDYAFKNMVKASSPEEVMNFYPPNKIKWSLKWCDFTSAIHLGKDIDFIVITDKGKVFFSDDEIEDNVTNVAIVPRKRPVDRIDLNVLKQSTKENLEDLKTCPEKNLALKYFANLNSRCEFCCAAERVESLMLPILDSIPLGKYLTNTQDEVVKKFPMFPAVSFIPPDPVKWKLVSTKKDKKDVDEFRCKLNGLMRKLRGPESSGAINEMKKLAEVWMNPELNPCIVRAAESFNSLLDGIRERVKVITIVLDYIELLKSVGDKSTEVYPQIAKMTEDCPYLQLSKKAERIVELSEKRDDAFVQLTKQIDELSAIYQQKKSQNEAINKANEELRQQAKDTINSYKKQIIQLQIALKKAGVNLEDDG